MELKLIFIERKITGKITLINDLFFTIVYIYFRIYYLYEIVQLGCYSESSYTYKLFGCLLQTFNHIWSWQIINMFIKKLYDFYPDSTPLKKLYHSMKALRPFGFIVNIICFLAAFNGWVFKELGIERTK